MISASGFVTAGFSDFSVYAFRSDPVGFVVARVHTS